MTDKIIIGLEAHDATGKSETSEVLAKGFWSSIYKVSDEMKSEDKHVSPLIFSRNSLEIQVQNLMNTT